MEKEPYQRINCDYYDELTLLAVRKKECLVVYTDEAGKHQERRSIIKDIYTKDQAEYLLLTDETIIRLDRLISIT